MNAIPTERRIRPDDVLLALLGLAAGPLLWWLANLWLTTPAASALHTFEYWIGLVFGAVGVLLCGVWAWAVLAGITLIIATVTRNAVVSYWAARCTPKLLRRLIVAVIGTHLTFSAHAMAAVEDVSQPTATSQTSATPFMPSVVELSPTQQSVAPSEEAAAPSAPTSLEPSVASPSPEPRHESPLPVKTQTTAPVPPDPTPREVSTIEVTPRPVTPPAPQHHRPVAPAVPSPYIAAPKHTDTGQDPSVIVLQGDCLWDIAHEELGRGATMIQIDQRWRQWWSHNRQTIGDNPHVLIPGTTLFAPPFTG